VDRPQPVALRSRLRGAPQIDDLRLSIESRRKDIADTIAEIERRLRPDRIRRMAADRLYDATADLRKDPVGHLRAWSRDLLTRLREMAWMNPVGLGAGAFIAGWLMGRRRR